MDGPEIPASRPLDVLACRTSGLPDSRLHPGLSGPTLNFGYRRKMTDRLNLFFTAQDVLDSGRHELVLNTPDLHQRIEQRGVGRFVFFGISYNLGTTTGRQRQEPGFDFSPQGGGDTPG